MDGVLNISVSSKHEMFRSYDYTTFFLQLDFLTDYLSENVQCLTDMVATYRQHLPKGTYVHPYIHSIRQYNINVLLYSSIVYSTGSFINNLWSWISTQLEPIYLTICVRYFCVTINV